MRPSPEAFYRTVYTRSWNGSGYYNSVAHTLCYLYREHYSTVTPNFHQLAKEHRLPDRPYSSSGYRIWTNNQQSYNYRVADGLLLAADDNPVWFFAGAMPFSTLPPELVQQTENKAFTRFSAQLSSVRVNVAEFFGERKQTAHMLANTARRVASAASALKRADLRGFTHSLSLTGSGTRRVANSWRHVESLPVWKRIPNLWLEYVYGWKPLIQDAYSATQMLKDYVGTHPHQSYVHARASQVLTVPVIADRSGLGHLCYDRTFTHKVTVRVKAHAVCESQLSSVLAETGITNPALLAWELLPYSFVVDWFLPVGNYLESLTAFDGFTLTGGTVSTLVSSVMTGASSAVGLGPGETFVGGNCGAQQWAYSLQLRLPYYRPILKSPIGGEPYARFATAMSLLTQLFHGK